MNKYLSNTNLYHLRLAGFLFAIFAVAYSLFDLNHVLKLPADKVRTETEETIITSGDLISHVAIPYTSRSNQTFGKPNHKRNHKNHFSSGAINQILHFNFSNAYESINANPEKVSGALRKIRIHLFNCILLN